MNCTIITIGDELLIGQTIDTNSAWIGQKLNAMGITLKERMAVGDDKSAIINALERAKSKSDVILITGGLGPTKDDITKAAFCEFFGVEEVLHEETFDRIKRFFEKRGKELIPMNKKQAMLPANCTVLSNERGTAPGMWFDENNIIYVSMPGVPHEMKHLMETHVIPRLAERFPLPTIVHKNMMVVGLGESRIAQMISEIEDSLPSYIKLAYLPELGVVKLRLSGYEIFYCNKRNTRQKCVCR
jgi:nicotinamide-nucleotide amidase